MDSHQQPARAHPARDPTRTRVVGAFNPRSTSPPRKAAPHRRHGVVRCAVPVLDIQRDQ
jgi:hypothetical protein